MTTDPTSQTNLATIKIPAFRAMYLTNYFISVEAKLISGAS